jgi:uncharacterized heparinase superfamily protein
MALGATIVMMDSGMPPPGEVSRAAHAGCLSFEMSSGKSPLIVNCGAPFFPDHESTAAARSTAAHSTAIVNDTSSCRFKLDGVIGRYLGNRIIGGPQVVTCKREDGDSVRAVTASHDGYVRGFGIVHERHLVLDEDGARLSGRDSFLAPKGKLPRNAERDRVAVRFHLHPSVRVEELETGSDLLLWMGGGEAWKFTSPQVVPQLEESIFFASAGGLKRTMQIVLEAGVAEHAQIGWSLERQQS